MNILLMTIGSVLTGNGRKVSEVNGNNEAINENGVDEMDREKVIKWLEYDYLPRVGAYRKDCKQGCDACMPMHDGDDYCDIDMLCKVLALLKEQEAVEPRVSTAEQRCGHCNKVIEMDGWIACPWCGKRIDWKGWWKKNGARNQNS